MPRAIKSEQYFDFDAEEPDTNYSPCTFKLGGQEWACRPTEQVPWYVVDRILEAGGNQTPIQVGPFFRAILAPDQVEDFMAMVNAPDTPLTLGILSKVMEHIATHVLNRPTERPTSSGVGSRTTRRTSKAASSSPDTRASTA